LKLAKYQQLQTNIMFVFVLYNDIRSIYFGLRGPQTKQVQ